MKSAVVLFALAIVALSASSFGAPPDPPATLFVTLHARAFACATSADGVCLGYDAAVPGPLFDVNVGDTLVVTLVNDIASTLPPASPAHLATTNVSFHAHGTALAVESDGVPAHAGTRLVDSTVGPGDSRVFTLRAAYAGSWHYHDHAIGPDGKEGSLRGLYGTLVVREPGALRPASVFDAHVLDAGINGGFGLAGAAAVGSSFEIDATGLGEYIWSLDLRSPSGFVLDSRLVGPGVSERFVVIPAASGTYSLTATMGPISSVGTVVVS